MAADAINVSSPRDRVAVAEFVGDHDVSGKEAVDELLHRLVADNNVVVDLCSATFIDSSVLNSLLRADRAATEQSHELRIYVSDSSIVSNLLSMTGLTEKLTIVTTLDEATA